MIDVDVVLESSLCRQSLLTKCAIQYIRWLVYLALVTVKLVVSVELFTASRAFDELWFKFEMNKLMLLKALGTDRDPVAFIASEFTARLFVVVFHHLKCSNL